jgi:GDP/UDP-N,N'-diacetylbacillosamine 2-epimerase (hydrolysing)
MQKKQICIITATRAEYGLLKNIIISLDEQYYYDTKIIVTGSHLSKLHGYTIDNIKNDNIKIDYELDMLLASDTNQAIGKSISVEIMGLSDYFKNNKFDYLILLGDRYEILAAALVATIFQIKIIHFCGGDTTEGAYDEDLRNAITQLSHIHFVTCDESKKKVESFGKNNVFIVGNPGLEYLLDFKPSPKQYNNYVMFVYHPETKNLDNMDRDLIEIEKVFDYILDKGLNLIIIGSNADNSNIKIKNLYNKYKNKIIFFDSVDRQQYLSLAYHCDLFAGNSSSGPYEISTFNKYIINIGDRQKGRRNINNVINVKCKFEEIKECIDNYFGKTIISEGGFPILKTSKLVNDILNNIL